MSQHAAPTRWRLFIPKLVTCIKEGYGWPHLKADGIAGLTVAIVALPLAMALAIASGTTPERGLITVIIAGFVISAFGGSRFQIGGPTGAFVVVVYGIIAQYGYDGLVLATLMAGALLVLAGLAGFGTWIKYVPQPVVVGFTAGIAVIIFSSQVKDFLGLAIEQPPAGFAAQWQSYLTHIDLIHPTTLALALASLGLIIALRRWRPQAPGFLIAVTVAAAATALFTLPVETIGTRFGGIPSTLPSPSLPRIDFARLAELLPSAFTIAFLAGVESLLSAVVADGMTGRRHRSNCELVAQGLANSASVAFGGIPATGAIARTATNIRAGGRTPFAGIFHALFVLLFMLLLAPLASFVPLAGLAAVLFIVAWNMSEVDRFKRLLLHAPWDERLVLVITFGLTVAVDLTVAIEVGVVFAAMLFMHRMTRAVAIQSHDLLIEEDQEDTLDAANGNGKDGMRAALPPGVEAYQIRGPFFFGVADLLGEVMERISAPPKIFILRMRLVPMVDATGAQALESFVARCRRHDTEVILTGLQPQPREVLDRMGLLARQGVREESDFRSAVEKLTFAAPEAN
ncbi:SulP family inorganic anion transporter [Limibacillus halophilus]|uniref:SulP family sulfate permease n=1 Tax=Limibacillus halophilus TaxID=1579333 RepID=A0A839SW52_9PROT|nr:SulP family inorganic anion transporter [Limibacillus halophilus]MBB3066269.1 SulP family sulfate permease [Limibacillus halophilus]